MNTIGFLGFGVVLQTGETRSYISQFTNLSLEGVRRKLFEEWNVVEKDIGNQPEIRLKLESFPMIYFCKNARKMTNQASCLFTLDTMMIFFNLAINVQSVTKFESELFFIHTDPIIQSNSILLKQPDFVKSVHEIISCRDSGKEYKSKERKTSSRSSSSGKSSSRSSSCDSKKECK